VTGGSYAGIYGIRIVPPSAAADILADAIAGDTEAKRLLAACADAHRRIKAVTEPSQTTSSCMICDARFWRDHTPEVIVVVGEYDNDGATPGVFGICSACFATHNTARALKNAVLAGCGARLGEPLRQLPMPIATAGHA
jgi:hypothetical protein